MLKIRDWSIALELDKKAALYVRTELLKLDAERERRDREFWRVMFGGEADPVEDGPTNGAMTEDELIARTSLGRRY